jgi:hypothetical protein
LFPPGGRKKRPGTRDNESTQELFKLSAEVAFINFILEAMAGFFSRNFSNKKVVNFIIKKLCCGFPLPSLSARPDCKQFERSRQNNGSFSSSSSCCLSGKLNVSEREPKVSEKSREEEVESLRSEMPTGAERNKANRLRGH